MASLTYSWEAITEELSLMDTYAYYKLYGIAAREEVLSIKFTISGVGYWVIAHPGMDAYNQEHLDAISKTMDSHKAIATVIAENIVRLENADQTLKESWSGRASDEVHTQLLGLIATLKRQAQALDTAAGCTACYLKMMGEFRAKYMYDEKSGITYGQ